MPTLSVIIITKNEEKDIEKCLKSVSWADEIIILDSGSEDRTVEICRKYTPLVMKTDWPGFGIQKNRALAKATSDWILSLDADEWLTPGLVTEIKEAIKDNNDYAYNIPRASFYCGKLIRFGHWGSDQVLRLFKRSCAKFSEDAVHEKLQSLHPQKKLRNKIMHNAFVDHADVITTMNNYSSLAAKQRKSANKSSNLLEAISHGLWAFIKSYILKLGLLDGKEGFMLAFSFAEGSYYKYVKQIS